MLVQSLSGGRLVYIYKMFAAITFVLSFATVNSLFITKAYAGSRNYQEDKVIICHRTNSVNNPYVSISIDKSAYDGSSSKSDHLGEHTGPIIKTTSEAKQLKEQKIKWGDKYLSDTARGKTDKDNNTEEECVVNPTEPINNDDKKNDVNQEDKNSHEDNKSDDDCRDEEKPKEEPKEEEKDLVVVTLAKEIPSTPQVLSQSTPIAQPQELAKTGINPVLGSIVGLSIITIAGLMFRKTKLVENHNFDYTI